MFPCHSIKPDATCTCGHNECASPGKHPLLGGGCHTASTDMGVITGWWKRMPWANVAIATGKIIVLDIDTDKGGADSLKKLEQEHGPLPETPVSLTGGGGEHYLFVPPEGAHYGNRARLGGHAGVDIRGEGGYIIAPPSLHLSGQRYLWDVVRHPQSVPIATIPQWLRQLMVAPFPVNRVRLSAKEKLIPVGTRNEVLFRDSCGLRDKGYGEEVLRAFLKAANTQCAERMENEEINLILSSVMRYSPTVPDTGKLRSLELV